MIFRFFCPDYTVGFGIAPKSANFAKGPRARRAIARITAGGELRPALETICIVHYIALVFNKFLYVA
jgi:hypothetical protein